MMEERVAQSGPLASAPEVRDVVFLSKATPGDDEFALWLAPKLEAAGYRVFTDIRTLEPGDRWRNVITSTLQNQACKMLLCCSNETLAAGGVQEEIEIGLDLAKELKDSRFVIPLRMRPYKKLFGIGGLQYIDFVRGWAEGLEKLLEALKRQKVPVKAEGAVIQPSWELYRRRGSVALKDEPERLTSNWLRISEAPDVINYFEPSGVVDRDALARIAPKSPYPVALMQKGFVPICRRSCNDLW
jgi:TIR domain